MTADHVDARGAQGLTAVGGAGRLVDEADAVIATIGAPAMAAQLF